MLNTMALLRGSSHSPCSSTRRWTISPAFSAVTLARLNAWARLEAKLAIVDRHVNEHGLIRTDGELEPLMRFYISIENSARLALTKLEDSLHTQGFYQRESHLFHQLVTDGGPGIATLDEQLARMERTVDDYAAAIKLQEALVALRLRCQGDDHHETVNSKNDIAALRNVVALDTAKRRGWTREDLYGRARPR